MTHHIRHPVVLIATLLTALTAALGASLAPAQAATARPLSANTTLYGIHNEAYGCVVDPGHNNIIYVRTSCPTYINFIDPVTEYGYTWYLIEMNGGPDCMNYNPTIGFFGSDSCIAGDPNEMFEHHNSSELGTLDGAVIAGGLASPGLLSLCNATWNSRLMILSSETIIPPSCNFLSSVQTTFYVEPN